MNAQDLIDLMPIVADRGWSVGVDLGSGDPAIRDRDGRCPLCALAHEISGGKIDLYGTANLAMGRLGVRDYCAISSVMNAADYTRGHFRLALKAALGMRP